jgi:hypothetical protein
MKILRILGVWNILMVYWLAWLRLPMVDDLLRLWLRLRLRIVSVRLLVRVKGLRVWLLVGVIIPVAGHQS